MELEIYSKSGSKSGKSVTLDDSIFGIEPHEHAMWLSINAYLANQRQGTHSTKGRSEVAGSTKKLFRQKGTGRARQGDIKSGLHPGGGTMHGPKPHKYTQALSRQVKQLARKSALSEKVKEGAFYVVEDFGFSEPKSKHLQNILNALKVHDRQVLLLTAKDDANVYLSGRNIPTLSILAADKASMYHIWKSRLVLVEASAIDTIHATFNGGVTEQEVTHISVPA